MEQIKIKDLTFFYNKQEKPAIENLSFNIEKGDFVVLCGKSGCGKSTLLRCLKPIIKPYGKTLGDIIFENEKLEKLSERQQAEKIGFVMQNPEHQIVTDKVWHELAFGLESLGYSTDEIQLRVTEMAEYFGITDLYYNSVNRLSGGQKQLLNLAATMVMGPEILILDEPTAQLDPIAAENFLGTLKKINDELGITVILSEHRLDNVLAYGNKVIVMDSGKIQYCGEPYKILEHNIDEDVLKLMPMATRIYYESGMEGADEKTPISISDGRRWLERLVKNGSKNVEDIEKGLDKEINENIKRNISEDINKKVIVKNDYAIKCKNVWFRYEKASPDIIKGLNFEIKKGEIFAILGGNGTGKTTTMGIISGIRKAYRGKIKINGTVSALPQNVQTLFKEETVEDELIGVSSNLIEKMELINVLKQHPYDISGGQQQKVALAKVLAKNPDILLLDEPTKAIDGIYKESLGRLMMDLKNRGKTIVMVSHDLDFCGQYADRCGLFAQGNLIGVNNVRKFFTKNKFYTTSVNKMAGRSIENAVNKEDVVCFLKAENII